MGILASFQNNLFHVNTWKHIFKDHSCKIISVNWKQIVYDGRSRFQSLDVDILTSVCSCYVQEVVIHIMFLVFDDK